MLQASKGTAKGVKSSLIVARLSLTQGEGEKDKLEGERLWVVGIPIKIVIASKRREVRSEGVGEGVTEGTRDEGMRWPF